MNQSSALYKLRRYKSIEAIERMLDIVEKRRKGKKLKDLKKNKDEDASYVSRLERMGKNLIENVERGMFPVTTRK
jgi:hypothetical protein